MELTDPGVNGQDSSHSPSISDFFTDKTHGADHSLGYDLREPRSLHGALDWEILEKESIAREMEKGRVREKMIIYEMARRDIMMQMGYSDPQTVLPSSSHQAMDFLEGKMAPRQSCGTEEGKPSAKNISGTKRKAESPLPPPPRAPEAIDVPSVNNNNNNSMKKTEDDGLYCKVCKFISTSKQALTDHLQGKKHKSKEVATASYLQGKKHKSKEVAAALNATKSENLKFPFWCDVCKVGAHTEDVMSCHERGRKHVKRFGITTEAKGVDAIVTHEVVDTTAESENDEQMDKANVEKDKLIEDIENEEVVCKGRRWRG